MCSLSFCSLLNSSWLMFLIRHRSPQARSPEAVRRGVSLSRYRSLPFIYIPGPRTYRWLHRALHRLHPCFAIRRASPHDQDGPRGVSSTADTYFAPILREYLDGFFKGFDEKLKDGHVWSSLGSDGGLVDLNKFRDCKVFSPALRAVSLVTP